MRIAANRIDMAMGAKATIKTENNATEKEVGQIHGNKPQKPPQEKFKPRQANIDGKEQPQYIRSVRTCGKDAIRKISTVRESSEMSMQQA